MINTLLPLWNDIIRDPLWVDAELSVWSGSQFDTELHCSLTVTFADGMKHSVPISITYLDAASLKPEQLCDFLEVKIINAVERAKDYAHSKKLVDSAT
jgi:hypothetical protein